MYTGNIAAWNRTFRLVTEYFPRPVRTESTLGSVGKLSSAVTERSDFEDLAFRVSGNWRRLWAA